MIRRISTKWLLAVLAVVVVPFSVFAYFVNIKVSERLGEDVVRFHLLSMAGDLGDRIDEEVEERRNDVELVSSIPEINWFVDGLDDDRGTFQANVELSIFRKRLDASVSGDWERALPNSTRRTFTHPPTLGFGWRMQTPSSHTPIGTSTDRRWRTSRMASCVSL